MRRRISSAVGGSNSKEMIVSVTLGAYMAAICSASRSVASLMRAADPLPEASLVMPIAFLRLACALRPEYSANPTFRTPFCAFCELTIFLQNNTLLALDAQLHLQ